MEQPEREANHSSLSSAKITNESIYTCNPYTPSWRAQGQLHLYFTLLEGTVGVMQDGAGFEQHG
jgi:hypothetical protein